MASLESDLRTFLLTKSAITDIVGTGDAARIRPYVMDEDDDDDQEHIIVEVDLDDRLNDIEGNSGMVVSDVNLLCRARTKSKSRALANAVRDELAGFTGTAGSQKIDAILEDQTSTITPVERGTDHYWYDTNMSFVIVGEDTG